MEAYEIESFICAFDDPYIGAQTYLNRQKVRLKGVSINKQDGVFHSYQSGLIFRKGKSWLCVCLKNCSLIVEGIYDETGTDIFDQIVVGDRFTTPSAKLERAKSRAVYTPVGLRKSN